MMVLLRLVWYVQNWKIQFEISDILHVRIKNKNGTKDCQDRIVQIKYEYLYHTNIANISNTESIINNNVNKSKYT